MAIGDTLDAQMEAVAKQIVDAAFKVHAALGPGLLEGVYSKCMVVDLLSRSLSVSEQVPVPIIYRGHTIEPGLRLDLLVEDAIIIEIKSVEKILPVHKAQTLSYMKLSNKRLGFLINFNVQYINEGITRLIN